jgi:hypothetical protein
MFSEPRIRADFTYHLLVISGLRQPTAETATMKSQDTAILTCPITESDKASIAYSDRRVIPEGLKHRLRMFALGLGASCAEIVQTPYGPSILQVIDRQGDLHGVEIDIVKWPLWQWYNALDRLEQLHDEHPEAGLLRFIANASSSCSQDLYLASCAA